MFVHGGISDDEEILSDCCLYSIQSQKWSICAINEETPAPRLYGHTMILALQDEQRYNPKLNIYKFAEIRASKKGLKVFIL